MNLPAYTVVIATLDRAASLAVVLRCLAEQTHRPERVLVADASTGSETRAVVESWQDRLPVEHRAIAIRSSAIQRNTAAAEAKSPVIVFLDDDIDFPPTHLTTLCAVFATDVNGKIAGVSGREANLTHPLPHGLVRLYYRMQAGYAHPNYGAQLFGAAITCVPCYADETRELIPADWLPAACVAYRRDYFARERFPDFAEYSAMEDVHASARIARHGQLFFAAHAVFNHHSGTSAFKRDAFALARHRMTNRKRVAREILGLGGWRLAYRLLLHRLFLTAVLLRARPPHWWREIAGTWAST